MRASSTTVVIAVCVFLMAAGAGAVVEIVDFDALPTGTVVTELFGSGGSGPILVEGVNGRFPGINAAVIFDTANPTGGDSDLGTPNETFSVGGVPGPGRGVGGVQGSAFENPVGLGKLLIIDEHMVIGADGLVVDPDDEGESREVTFKFDFSAIGPVTVRRLTVIDIEDREKTPTVRFFDANGPIGSVELRITGDNGVWPHPVRDRDLLNMGPTAGVVRMDVELHGSGAISSVEFEPSRIPPPKPCIDIEKLTNGNQADLATDPDVPFVEVGQPVVWTYLVTNPCTDELQNVSVTDDRGALVSCPRDTLGPGESMECSAEGVAVDLVRKDLGYEAVSGICREKENQPVYANVGYVAGVGTVSELTVTDSDPSHYCSSTPPPPEPRIYVRKQKKGPDTRSVPNGATPTFEIFVKNTGEVDLVNVTVADVLAPDCDRSFERLAAGESKTYTCTAPALNVGGDDGGECRLVNEVVASGQADGRTVTDRDTSTVRVADLKIEKTFTGVSEKAARFEITVTNNGCDLEKVEVTDELAPDCARAIGAMAAGATETYACSMPLEFENEACADGGGGIRACDSVTFEVGDCPDDGDEPGPDNGDKPKPENGDKPGPDNGDKPPKKASNWLLLLALALLVGGGLFAWNRMKAG